MLHAALKRKRGRSVNADAMQAFDMPCDKLENESENDLYTFSEMHQMMCDIAGNDVRNAYIQKAT